MTIIYIYIFRCRWPRPRHQPVATGSETLHSSQASFDGTPGSPQWWVAESLWGGRREVKFSDMICWLVVWNMNFIFPSIGNFIIPTDFHIFQRGRYTTNQDMIWVCLEIGDLKLQWLIICVMFSMKKLFGPFGCRPHCQRIHISSQNWKKQFAGC